MEFEGNNYTESDQTLIRLENECNWNIESDQAPRTSQEKLNTQKGKMRAPDIDTTGSYAKNGMKVTIIYPLKRYRDKCRSGLKERPHPI